MVIRCSACDTKGPTMSELIHDGLEPLLRALESEIAEAGRRAHRRALRSSAARYRRSEPMLAGLLSPGLLHTTLADHGDPAITWQVLRCLCRHIRFNRRSSFGSSARLMRCEMVAAGEARLLGQQRMARREQAFLGRFFGQMRRAGAME